MPTPLLYLPLKIPVRYDLVHPLAEWLDDDGSQTAFDSSTGKGPDAPPSGWVVPKPTYSSVQCRSELLRIAALRNCMSESLQDSHKAALEAEMLRDCKDYHATLLKFEQEGFPTSFDDSIDNTHSIQLTWRGAFGTKGQESHSSLLWDRMSTLWNVAALQSAQAAFDSNESSKDGLKIAIANLQTAASHLSLCQQLVESLPDFTISTVDMSKPMLQFWQKLLLAQAQVSIYKLANHKDAQVRNHTTLACLIQGAAPLYNAALQCSQEPRMQSEVPQPCKEWAAHCKAQSMLCQARAYFHMSIAARIEKEHGTELSRLQQATKQLTELLQFCESTTILKEAVKLMSSRRKGDDTVSPMAAAAATIVPEAEALQRLASDRYAAALQDNHSVYMENVPTSLPEIRAQTMVKTNLQLAEDMTQPRAKLFVDMPPPLPADLMPPPPPPPSTPMPPMDFLPPPMEAPKRTDSDLARELQERFNAGEDF